MYLLGTATNLHWNCYSPTFTQNSSIMLHALSFLRTFCLFKVEMLSMLRGHMQQDCDVMSMNYKVVCLPLN